MCKHCGRIFGYFGFSSNTKRSQLITVAITLTNTVDSNVKSKYNNKTEYKRVKLHKIARELESSLPDFIKPDVWCKSHTKEGPAVFATSVDINHGSIVSQYFTKTLRNTGYKGDIVVSVLPNSKPGFMKQFEDTDAIVYTVNVDAE